VIRKAAHVKICLFDFFVVSKKIGLCGILGHGEVMWEDRDFKGIENVMRDPDMIDENVKYITLE